MKINTCEKRRNLYKVHSTNKVNFTNGIGNRKYCLHQHIFQENHME